MTTPPPAVPVRVVEKIEALEEAAYEYGNVDTMSEGLRDRRAAECATARLALVAAIADAIAEGRAREALRKYGDHLVWCDLMYPLGPPAQPLQCTCAYRAALGEEPADGDTER